jgi:hypothetical protein
MSGHRPKLGGNTSMSIWYYWKNDTECECVWFDVSGDVSGVKFLNERPDC